MRPTQSHDTILDGVFVPDARIGRVVPAGDGSDLFLVGDGDVGAAADRHRVPRHRRAGARAGRRPAPAARRRSPSTAGAYAYNPMVQHQVAEMYLELDAATATVDRFVDDWVAGADHGDAWVPKVYSMKWRAVEAAKRVVDIALDVAGGAGMFTRQRARAALPRRPLRRLPPRQRRPHPRDGRQGRARHPRRAAPLVSAVELRGPRARARRRRRRRARRPRATRRLVGVVAERGPQPRRRARPSATSSAPKMRWPGGGAPAPRPSSTAASRRRPSRASSPAIERSIVHCVDHMPARRQWASSRR